MPTKVATVAPASSLRTQCLLVEVVMPELLGAPSDWAGGAGWAGGGAPAAVPAQRRAAVERVADPAEGAERDAVRGAVTGAAGPRSS